MSEPNLPKPRRRIRHPLASETNRAETRLPRESRSDSARTEMGTMATNELSSSSLARAKNPAWPPAAGQHDIVGRAPEHLPDATDIR